MGTIRIVFNFANENVFHRIYITIRAISICPRRVRANFYIAPKTFAYLFEFLTFTPISLSG